MNNNVMWLGLLLLLSCNKTIDTTQVLILLALLSTENQNNCNCERNNLLSNENNNISRQFSTKCN